MVILPVANTEARPPCTTPGRTLTWHVPPPPCPPLQGSCTHTSSDCSSWVTDGEIQALNTGMGRGAFPLACKQVFQILASTTAGADSRASAQGVAQAAHRILVEEFGLQD